MAKSWKTFLIIFIILSLITAAGVTWYKLKDSGSSTSDATSSTDSKVPIPAPIICPSFSKFESTDIAGFDLEQPLTNLTEEQCKSACLSKGCQWFNYNSQTKTCYLKKAKVSQGVITGFRLLGIPENAKCSSYAVYNDSDISGFDMKNMPLTNKTQDECQNECKHSECHWYNYNTNQKKCWLKKGTTKQNVFTVVPVPYTK